MEAPAKNYIFDLERIITRCFQEGRKAGWVSQVETVREGDVQAIADEHKLVQHISKTVIGELHELELINRLAPIFRSIRQLAHEFEEVDAAHAAEARRLNIRKDPTIEGAK